MGSNLKDFVLYCKSYRNDFLRLKRLLASIEQFNADSLPFYTSTPQADHALLLEIIGASGYEWVADEDIVQANPKAAYEKYRLMPGGLSQAIIKSEFWRLDRAQNYLCLDSDAVFIRPFYRHDFMANETVPYTVIHQNKEYFQLTLDRGHQHIVQNLQAEAVRVQAVFERSGPLFYGAPAPFIWSAEVWRSLEREYLAPKDLSIWDLVSPELPETLIYIEAAMKYQAIPLIVIEPLFRVYHYDWQYFMMKRLGESVDTLKINFLGVIYQSNWESHLHLEGSQKSLPSRVLKRIKKSLRYLQSYI